VKTEVLLAALEPAAYAPIDIALDFLALTAKRVRARFPQLNPGHTADRRHHLTLRVAVYD
jgi:uncharacterized SAM-dependent methyltransferase